MSLIQSKRTSKALFSVDEHPKEKCGVVGVWTKDKSAPYLARRALAALQHRGQEGAGLSVLDSHTNIVTHKGMGLIPNVLTEEVLKQLGEGHFAIAQNRYGTSGSGNVKNAQPIERKHNDLQMTLGHNGNIPEDLPLLRKKAGDHSKQISDTSLVASIIMKERIVSETWETALVKALPQFRGAFCNIILTNEGSIYGMRDPLGIRPLCLGTYGNGWIIASESVSLDTTGADFVRDIAPGEIIKIDKKGNLTSYFFGEPKRPQYCLFEYIYFARPDSFLNGRRVRTGRETSGVLLGKRIKAKKIKADGVVPTFDSGYPAAKGVAKELNLPIIDAITTSHYVGRTFIQPGQNNRIAAVSGKHNIIPDEVYNKRIIIVDDSAVRLTTSTRLARGFKAAGAKEVYMAFSSPPVVDQCDLGIDMRTRKELPAAKFAKLPFETIEEKVAKHIGADGVVYLPIEETARAMNGRKEDFYYTPFGGPHPIRSKQEVFPKRNKPQIDKPKIAIFLSGRGTFVQDIIDGIKNKTINAEISEIVSNKKDAYGVTRAQEHKIPAHVFEFTNKLRDKVARKTYEKELIAHLKENEPDLIILSGWQMILGETFLKAMQEMQIPVINHHPALLTSNSDEMVATSKGLIPVMRGGSVWQETFAKRLPVSGISVHQVLPGDTFDVGPIIMKAEVPIVEEDTLETWRQKMDAAEHLLFPTAIKRILHVIRHNIDISSGNFPW